MLCFMTHRRLKPGSFEAFRKAWEPDEMPPGLRERAFHVRSLSDPNEIVSFGLADMAVEDLPAFRDAHGGAEAEARRQERMAPYVEWTGIDGIFEVVEELVVGE
ncbi:MAG: hypothetical protein QOK40_316 [Miltoncostaeaceae bacterium]|jgi:hypothetical protein|nr:hypothetical protein [Miltoncostaeaceae bacterium]